MRVRIVYHPPSTKMSVGCEFNHLEASVHNQAIRASGMMHNLDVWYYWRCHSRSEQQLVQQCQHGHRRGHDDRPPVPSMHSKIYS